MSNPRVYRDKDGDLWAEYQSGRLVDLETKVLRRVAEKFGDSSVSDVEEDYGPLTELVAGEATL